MDIAIAAYASPVVILALICLGLWLFGAPAALLWIAVGITCAAAGAATAIIVFIGGFDGW